MDEGKLWGDIRGMIRILYGKNVLKWQRMYQAYISTTILNEKVYHLLGGLFYLTECRGIRDIPWFICGRKRCQQRTMAKHSQPLFVGEISMVTLKKKANNNPTLLVYSYLSTLYIRLLT